LDEQIAPFRGYLFRQLTGSPSGRSASI
jgi:hypothetical protein